MEGNVEICNQAFTKVFGWETQELVGQKLNFVPQENLAETNVQIKRIRKGKDVEFESKRYTKDGQILDVEISAGGFKDAQNSLIGSFVILRDVTKSNKMAEELKTKEERYASVLRSNPDAIVVYNEIGQVTFLNPAFTKFFGWTLKEKKGKKMDQFVPRENWPETKIMIKKVIEGTPFSNIETKRYDNKKRLKEVSISGASFSNLKGDISGSIITLRDITKRKKSEKKIKKLNLELNKKAKDLELLNHSLEKAVARAKIMTQKAKTAALAKSEFLANMSHEIRTPLNGVTGMLDLLSETDLTNEQLEFTTSIQASSDALLMLINDILDFSKIEAGKLDMEEIEFDLRLTLENLSDLMAIKANEKGIEFACLINNSVPCFLKGDPGRLRQIAINLSGNAIKFVEKGEVSISVELEKETDKKVTLLFKIKDTGIGIPPNKLDQLFNSFSQVETSTTRKYGGTGLGLTISKQLSELMGGQIGVESVEGKGSIFWFTIVLKKQLNPKSQELPIPDNIRGKNILIVDNLAINRLVLKEYLKGWQCRFDEAENGNKAIAKLKKAVSEKAPFDIAILDMHTSKITGENLGQKIKKDSVLKQTHLIMTTSLGQRGDTKKMEKIGFAAFVTKPVKKAALLDCFKTILNITDEKDQNRDKKTPRHTTKETRLYEKESVQALKILLAEDNLINQKVGKHMLKKMGHIVEVVNNGEEAVGRVAEKKFDLILMDGQMPVMDGIEATKAIRHSEKISKADRTPIIAVTANAMKGDREIFLGAGMDDYVSKPLTKTVLEKVINRVIK
ncbi:MAG: response regulator [Desulfobacteraceae bacterium]|nr:response regulator [Desulfobacteraceae bacterium]